jgi:hypothetical protein
MAGAAWSLGSLLIKYDTAAQMNIEFGGYKSTQRLSYFGKTETQAGSQTGPQTLLQATRFWEPITGNRRVFGKSSEANSLGVL